MASGFPSLFFGCTGSCKHFYKPPEISASSLLESDCCEAFHKAPLHPAGWYVHRNWDGYGKCLMIHLSKTDYFHSHMLNYQRVTHGNPKNGGLLLPHSWLIGQVNPWREGVQILKRHPDQSCRFKFVAQLARNKWTHRFKYGFLTPCSTVFPLHSSSIYDRGPLQAKIDADSFFATPSAKVYHLSFWGWPTQLLPFNLRFKVGIQKVP